jgi:hypothetical protein
VRLSPFPPPDDGDPERCVNEPAICDCCCWVSGLPRLSDEVSDVAEDDPRAVVFCNEEDDDKCKELVDGTDDGDRLPLAATSIKLPKALGGCGPPSSGKGPPANEGGSIDECPKCPG